MIAIVDEAQAVEGEAVVDFGDVFRFAGDEVGEAAGGNTLCFRAELGDHALEDRIDEADVAPEQTDLEIVDGVGPDDFCGTANLDTRQTRGAGKEGFGRDVEAGGDGSAEELTFAGDDVEIRGGAEVDDDGGASIFVERADAVRNAIGADFGGIVGEDGEAGFDAGFDEERLQAEVAAAELAEDPIDGRDDGGDDNAADGSAFDAFALKKAADEDAVFIGGLTLTRADAPGGAEGAMTVLVLLTFSTRSMV